MGGIKEKAGGRLWFNGFMGHLRLHGQSEAGLEVPCLMITPLWSCWGRHMGMEETSHRVGVVGHALIHVELGVPQKKRFSFRPDTGIHEIMLGLLGLCPDDDMSYSLNSEHPP